MPISRLSASKQFIRAAHFLILVWALSLLMSPQICLAQQASLASENIIEEVPVTVADPDGNKIEKYTVLRDAKNDNQWYYIPNQPHLSEIAIGDHQEPEFTLLRYAARDAANNAVFNGGGLLQFSVSLSAPQDVIEQLKSKISEYLQAQGKSVPTALLLGAIPFQSAEAYLYSPDTGQLLGSSPLGTGVAPTFATQKIVFTVPLTELGTDVYEALVNGNTGVHVAIRFKYNGLTPPAGFSVDVDWQQAYNFYSSDIEARAQGSYFGLFGGSAAYSSQTIREKLEQNKVIKINVTSGGGLSDAQIDSFLQPIVKRINDEILTAFQPPEKIDPAVAPATSGGAGIFASGSLSVAVKDVSKVKHNVERIEFNHSMIVDRETVASGLIGIGRYSAAIRQKLVTAADTTHWEMAYLPLPAVPNAVDRINMSVRLNEGGRSFASQDFSWTKSTGWLDPAGRAADKAAFSLLELKSSRGDDGVKGAKYDIQYSIEANQNNLSFVQSLPILNESVPVAAPNQLVDIVQIDPSGLAWKGLDSGSELSRVTVSMSSGQDDFVQTFRPAKVNGVLTEPPAVNWVVPKKSGGTASTLSGKVEYRVGNSTKSWPFDDLRKAQPDLQLHLDEIVN